MRRLITLLAFAAGLAACTPNGGTLFTPKQFTPVSGRTMALMQDKGMEKNAPILVRIYKADAKLEVWKKQSTTGKYAFLKSFDICRWSGDLGPKVREGDRQAPEGFYTITPAHMNPGSSYYLAFNTGFPNAFDRAHNRFGSNLMVHGDCSSRGCYAMTNDSIEEIYALARDAFDGGQKGFQLQLLPFRMTADNLYKFRKNQNLAFWKNLKEGTDQFEAIGDEPIVAVCAGRYVFNQVPFDANARFEPAGICPPAAVPAYIQNAVAGKAQQEAAVLAAMMDKDGKEKPSLLSSVLGSKSPEQVYETREKILAALPSSSPEALSLLPGVESGPTRELRRIAQLGEAPPPAPSFTLAPEPAPPPVAQAAAEPKVTATAPPKPIARRVAANTKDNSSVSLRGTQN